MIIQSLEHNLSVIRMIETTESYDILLCRDLLDESELSFITLRIKSAGLIRKLMPLLSSQSLKSSFRDFADCFTSKGDVICLFRYSQEETLREKMETTPYSFRERLDIAKSLFTAMTDLDMDLEMQTEALSDENLLMDDTLTIHFNYVLRELPEYGRKGMPELQTRLARLMRIIFDRELRQKLSPELRDFILDLEDGCFEDYRELYRAYNELYVFLVEEWEAGRLKPLSFLYRLWYKIRGLAKYVKPTLAILLISAALFYLIWTLTHTGGAIDSAAHKDFDKIGTVEISDNESGEGR